MLCTSCASLRWGFQVWGLWLWRARQQSFLGGLWVPTPLSGFTQLLSVLWLYSFGLTVPNFRNRSTHFPLTQYSVGCGSADTLKTMQLARKGGLRWNKEKIKVCSWHKTTVYVQWVSPTQTSTRATLCVESLSTETWWIFVKDANLLCLPAQMPKNQSNELCDTWKGI